DGGRHRPQLPAQDRERRRHRNGRDPGRRPVASRLDSPRTITGSWRSMRKGKQKSLDNRKTAVEDDIDVGARLRSLRQIYGLSQRELARRAGVTNGTISLIELNQTSPQLASLKRILNAFPITVAEFFTFDLQSRERVFFRHQELTEIGGGALSFKLVAAQRHDRRLQVTHEIYQPGADTGPDMI